MDLINLLTAGVQSFQRTGVCLVLAGCSLSLSGGAGMARAESSVWKVHADSSHLYLGGSSHLLRESDYPLPGEFGLAFSNSAVLILEVDVEGLKDPAIQAQLLRNGQLQETTLDQVLSPGVYSALSNHCQQLGLPLTLFNGVKPAMVVLTLTVLELQRLGVSTTGVDMYLADKAATLGKRQLSLETVDEQLNLILSMGEGSEDDFVMHSLREMKKTGTQMPELLDAWRSGDLETLETSFLEPMEVDYPELYQELVVDRNQAWLPQIESFLESAETEFVLVGALHLAGDDGLIAELKKRGHEVERVSVSE